MKRTNFSRATAWLICLSLLFSLCATGIVTDHASAATKRSSGSKRKDKQEGKDQQDSKIAHDLQDRMRGFNANQDMVKVILQLNNGMSGSLNALLRQHYDVHINGKFDNFNSLAVELPASLVAVLELFSEVKFVSTDSEVGTLGGHVAHTTGADNVRGLVDNMTLDGAGIGIAVLDSGIDPAHRSFINPQNQRSRIAISKDFTGEARTDDPYGHGTHVACAAGGNGSVSKGKYIGIAPNANLINLRVLNAQGKGTVSGLLAALDWVLTNSAKYNIRVVNMSLGMPAVNSYKNDPLCLAARRLVDAGIFVVAAAGNDGKSSVGQKAYGQIHAPGNEPSVLTVGAADTHGTDNRADDTIASYSSRGPTRSYWTDIVGVKHYDNLIKPDLVAPGNKTVFAESNNNWLVKNNPTLDVGVSRDPSREMMKLSGTSMAAPIAAGAAALLLQANPKLTPNMIKMILMYTAQQLPNFNTFEQGAGELNIDGAMRLAMLVRTDLTASTAAGAPLLTTSTPLTPQTSIIYDDQIEVKDPITGLVLSTSTNVGTSTFQWSQGIVLNNTYATGTSLITKYQSVYGLGVLLGDGVLTGDGVLLGDAVLTSNGTTINSGSYFYATGALLGDGVLMGDGVLLGDGVLIGDGVLFGDSILASDAALRAYNAMAYGDATPSMAIEFDTGVDYLGY